MNKLVALSKAVILTLSTSSSYEFICIQVNDCTRARNLPNIDLGHYWVEFIKETTGKEIEYRCDAFIHNYVMQRDRTVSASSEAVVKLRGQWVKWLISNYS